jgi:hypothetical protein
MNLLLLVLCGKKCKNLKAEIFLAVCGGKIYVATFAPVLEWLDKTCYAWKKEL